MSLVPGTRLGRYEIRAKIGEGGMGEVYLAQDTKLDRKVAIKSLPESLVADEPARKRLLREAQAAARLDHPSICSIHEVGEEDGRSFIVMQYVEGETLDVRMKRKPLELSESLSIATQVADALAEAHAHGIIHRDIKPSNIIVTPRGQAKVMDFGLAKALPTTEGIDTEAATQSRLTTPGAIVGTVPYMSPEQVKAERVDARTDIFSFGGVLYEMLSGRQPFAGESVAATASAILTKEPLPLTRYVDDCPQELQRIERKCLAKSRDERYQTSRDLLIDLKNLSRALELKVESERSAPPVLRDEAPGGPGGRTLIETLPSALARPSSNKYFITTIKQRKGVALLMLAGFIVAVVVVILAYSHRTTAITEKDTILLADFDNTTGDAVFDGALKQALAIQLEQSPFLNVFPEERAREALKYMGRSPDQRVTKDVAREICQRQGVKAMLAGSILSLGSHYVIGLEAINAQTGDVIAREQAEAESKEQVLKTLGGAATKLREKVGESLASIQKFDAPVEQATTPSLEALKAFALGNEKLLAGGFSEAIALFNRALELDPNFALAYSKLAITHWNNRDFGRAAEFATKAFDLREERASERERLYISQKYYGLVTGELDKSIDVSELWKRSYPRDLNAHVNLAWSYTWIGQYEKAIPEAREAMDLNPNAVAPYDLLGDSFIALGRFDEARTAFQEAVTRGLDPPPIHRSLYQVAFIQGDRDLMQQQLDWAAGKPIEFWFLTDEANTVAFSGQLRKSQELFHRAISIAEQGGGKEASASNAAAYAQWAAMFGDCQQAKKETATALAFVRSEEALWRSGVALGLCGEINQARSFADELVKQRPKGTLVNSIKAPIIRAAVETVRGNPAQAIQLLQVASPYERVESAVPYIRGLAYLKQGAGAEAEVEFQQIIKNRSYALNPIYSLSYLGLARAAALTGDVDKSRKGYEDFFALWKDADPDIPILIEAKNEYGRLKQ